VASKPSCSLADGFALFSRRRCVGLPKVYDELCLPPPPPPLPPLLLLLP
jgi:hypothetical protein